LTSDLAAAAAAGERSETSIDGVTAASYLVSYIAMQRAAGVVM